MMRNVIAAAVVVVLFLLVRKLFAKKPESRHHVPAQCHCGWSGNVSKYAAKCPRCNSALTV